MSGVSISSFEKVTSRHSKRPGATPARTHLAGHARKGFANLTHRRQPSSAAVLLVAAFGAFLAFLDSTIVNIAFPDIQKSFPSYDLGSLSWILNAYNIVFAAFLVAAGRMADLLGRRRTFTFGVVIFTIASGLCAVAGSGEWLVAFRVLQGIGAAVLVPASLALVVEGFEPARRAHAVGLWGRPRPSRPVWARPSAACWSTGQAGDGCFWSTFPWASSRCWQPVGRWSKAAPRGAGANPTCVVRRCWPGRWGCLPWHWSRARIGAG
ncbi:sugar (and other) transporter family protein [Mycobacterium ulcerans str. Harvey]|uniref:Sugar (And other) transporter family protein n=1 Tax=Mycobacterium ulcerans str. Harvey TaxID=1299332 RepID=A0ABP3ADR8_MYCUL|nr:sugar (and other) transporter family protein [Mycobacterium ulcerans str. Harvey]